MLQAAVQLKDSTDWLSKAFEPEAPQGLVSPLQKQVQKHLQRVRSAEQFFFGGDSTFGGICDLLGYDEAEYRSKVTACLGEPGVLLRAEAFVDALPENRPRKHREARF